MSSVRLCELVMSTCVDELASSPGRTVRGDGVHTLYICIYVFIYLCIHMHTGAIPRRPARRLRLLGRRAHLARARRQSGVGLQRGAGPAVLAVCS